MEEFLKKRHTDVSDTLWNAVSVTAKLYTYGTKFHNARNTCSGFSIGRRNIQYRSLLSQSFCLSAFASIKMA